MVPLTNRRNCVSLVNPSTLLIPNWVLVVIEIVFWNKNLSYGVMVGEIHHKRWLLPNWKTKLGCASCKFWMGRIEMNPRSWPISLSFLSSVLNFPSKRSHKWEIMRQCLGDLIWILTALFIKVFCCSKQE